MNPQSSSTVAVVLNSAITGILAIMLVGAAIYDALVRGAIDSNLFVLATAAVGVYFGGQAARSVNGDKVAAIAASVQGIHARLDAANLPPASGRTVPPGPPAGGAA